MQVRIDTVQEGIVKTTLYLTPQTYLDLSVGLVPTFLKFYNYDNYYLANSPCTPGQF